MPELRLRAYGHAEDVAQSVLCQLSVALGPRERLCILRADDLRAVDVALGHQAGLEEGIGRFDQGLVPRERVLRDVDDQVREDGVVVGGLGQGRDRQEVGLELRRGDPPIVLGVLDRPRGHVDASPAQERLHDTDSVVRQELARGSPSGGIRPPEEALHRDAGSRGDVLADEGGRRADAGVRDAPTVQDDAVIVQLLYPHLLLTRRGEAAADEWMEDRLGPRDLGFQRVLVQPGDLEAEVLLEPKLDRFLERQRERPGGRRGSRQPFATDIVEDALDPAQFLLGDDRVVAASAPGILRQVRVHPLTERRRARGGVPELRQHGVAPAPCDLLLRGGDRRERALPFERGFPVEAGGRWGRDGLLEGRALHLGAGGPYRCGRRRAAEIFLRARTPRGDRVGCRRRQPITRGT